MLEDVVRVMASPFLLPASHYISGSCPIFRLQKHAGSPDSHHLTTLPMNMCRRVAA